jgi:hypothetical protein
MPLTCPQCTYDLTGMGDDQSVSCPECGMVIVLPGDRAGQPRQRSELWLLIAALATPLITLAAIVAGFELSLIVGWMWSMATVTALAWVEFKKRRRVPRLALSALAGITAGSLWAVISIVGAVLAYFLIFKP